MVVFLTISSVFFNGSFFFPFKFMQYWLSSNALCFSVDDSGDGDDGQEIDDGTSAKHTEERHVRTFIPTLLLCSF
jgi:hypothetical protein